MNTFSLDILASDRSERIDKVCSLVGEDRSGCFGLLANHERFITALNFGLVRITTANDKNIYLGFPGGVLYFLANACRISTRRYLQDDDLGRLAQALSHELLAEEQALHDTHHTLRQLESQLLQRLAELERS